MAIDDSILSNKEDLEGVIKRVVKEMLADGDFSPQRKEGEDALPSEVAVPSDVLEDEGKELDKHMST